MKSAIFSQLLRKLPGTLFLPDGLKILTNFANNFSFSLLELPDEPGKNGETPVLNFTLTMDQRKVTILCPNVKKITIHAELALICEIDTAP